MDPSINQAIRLTGGILYRLICFCVAGAVGWLVYMLVMTMTIYDGVLSLLFQPLMGILWSTAFLALAALGGLLLRIPPIGTRWRSSPLWAIGITLISLFAIFGSFAFGWTVTALVEEGGSITFLRSEIFCPSYFALLFAIAHWPIPPSLTSAPADSQFPPTSPSSLYPDP